MPFLRLSTLPQRKPRAETLTLSVHWPPLKKLTLLSLSDRIALGRTMLRVYCVQHCYGWLSASVCVQLEKCFLFWLKIIGEE